MMRWLFLSGFLLSFVVFAYAECNEKVIRAEYRKIQILLNSENYQSGFTLLPGLVKKYFTCVKADWLWDSLQYYTIITENQSSTHAFIASLDLNQHEKSKINKILLMQRAIYLSEWQLDKVDSLKKIIEYAPLDTDYQIKYLLQNVMELMRKDRYSDALQECNQIDSIFKNSINKQDLMDLNLWRLNANYRLERGADMATNVKVIDSILLITGGCRQDHMIEFEIMRNAVYLRQYQNKNALAHIEVLEKKFSGLSPALRDKYFILNQYQIANAFRDNYKIRKCDTVLRQILPRVDTNRAFDRRMLASVYYTLGLNQKAFGNIDESIFLFHKSIALSESLPFVSKRIIPQLYQQLGSGYIMNHNSLLAKEYLTKAYRLDSINDIQGYTYWRYYRFLIATCFNDNDSVCIKQYIEKWKDEFNKYKHQISPMAQYDYYASLMKSYILLNRSSEVLEEVQKYINDNEALLDQNGVNTGELKYNLSAGYYTAGNKTKGLTYLEQQKNEAKKFYLSNPTTPNLIHYEVKAEDLFRNYWHEFKFNQDSISLAKFQNIQAELMSIFYSLDSSDNNLNELNMIDENIYSIVDIMAEYTLIDKEESAFETINWLMERLPNKKYRNALTRNNVLRGPYLSNDEKLKIYNHRQKLISTTEKFFDHQDNQVFKNEYAEANIQIQKLISDIKSDHRNKSNTVEPDQYTIRKIKDSFLTDDECILRVYNYGDFATKLFISKDTIILSRTYDPEFLINVKKLETNYFQYFNATHAMDLKELASLSEKVYSIIFKDISNFLKPRIRYIPSTRLGALALESLISEQPTHISRINTWPSILKNYSVTNHLSIRDLVATLEPSRVIQARVYAFAPFSTQDTSADYSVPDDLSIALRSGLNPLNESFNEVNQIGKIMNAIVYTGSEANKNNLMSSISKTGSLHIASHGGIDTLNPEKSYIYLKSPDSNPVQKLYYGVIENMDINADFVALSACLSGSGLNISGQGIYSIDRAFRLAGVRNTLSALWPIPDVPTKELMILFYKEIKKGKSYSLALANAKRLFIQKYKQWAHPVYWAGFVLNGR